MMKKEVLMYACNYVREMEEKKWERYMECPISGELKGVRKNAYNEWKRWNEILTDLETARMNADPDEKMW